MNQQSAQHLQSSVTGFLSKQLDDRRGAIADQVGTQAESIRKVADALRTDGPQSAADLADGVAKYFENFSSYLSDRDPNALIHDLEDFSRKQPWAVAAGALVAGFAVSRVLKTSSFERYRSTLTGSGSH